MSNKKNKKTTNQNTNLVKSTTNDQIEINNDEVKEAINPEFISVNISCADCKHNPQNTTKREQFLNILGVQPNEEFYIEGTEKNPPYSIYKLSDDLYLSARSSNSKDWDMSWAANMFVGRLLSDDVKLIKIKK